MLCNQAQMILRTQVLIGVNVMFLYVCPLLCRLQRIFSKMKGDMRWCEDKTLMHLVKIHQVALATLALCWFQISSDDDKKAWALEDYHTLPTRAIRFVLAHGFWCNSSLSFATYATFGNPIAPRLVISDFSPLHLF